VTLSTSDSCSAGISGSLIETFVDTGYLFDPLTPETMIEVKDRVWLPVEVVGDVGYLLV
jgi:uncharacterized protein YdeI (BOF family)